MLNITNIASLRQALNEKIVHVEFEKMNGEKRIMLCTLQKQFLPESVNNDANVSVHPNIMSVWDTEKHGWRSFRTEKVLEWHVDE